MGQRVRIGQKAQTRRRQPRWRWERRQGGNKTTSGCTAPLHRRKPRHCKVQSPVHPPSEARPLPTRLMLIAILNDHQANARFPAISTVCCLHAVSLFCVIPPPPFLSFCTDLLNLNIQSERARAGTPNFPGNASAMTVFHIPGWAVRLDQLSHILWISGSPTPHYHLPHLFLFERIFIWQDDSRRASSSGGDDDLEHMAMKEESGNPCGRTHLFVSLSFHPNLHYGPAFLSAACMRECFTARWGLFSFW